MSLFNKNQKVGFLVQTNWATQTTASSNFRTQLVKTGSLPDPAVVIDTFNETSAYGNAEEVGRSYVDATSQLKSFAFDFTPNYFDLYWYFLAMFPTVTEGGSTSFQKEFTPSDFVNGSGISYAGDGAKVFGIAQGNYNNGSNAGDGTIIHCATLDELSFDIDFMASGISRLLQASAKWVGNSMVADQYFSGTWEVPISTGRLSGFSLKTLTVDTVDYSAVCVKKINISFKKNITPACVTTKANDYDEQFEMITTIDLVANATSIAAFGKYTNAFANGSPVNCAFSIGNGAAKTTVGALYFENSYGRLDANPLVTNGDKTEIRLVIKALRPAAGWAPVVSLADGIDRTEIS